MARNLLGPMGVLNLSAQPQASQQPSSAPLVASGQPAKPDVSAVAQRFRLPKNILEAYAERGEDPEQAAQRITAELDAGKSFADIVPKAVRIRASDIADARRGVKPEGGFGAAIGVGVDSIQQSLGSAVEGVGKATGIETLQNYGARVAEDNAAEAASGARGLKEYTDVSGIGSAAGFALEQTGQAAPQMGLSLAGGLAGGKAGAMAGAAFGPAGAVVGGAIGGVAGSFLPNLVMAFGQSRERQKEADILAGRPVTVDEMTALSAATVQGAIDTVVDRFIIGKLVPPNAAGSIFTRTVKDAATGAAVEAPTEVAQQMIERAQAGLDLTSEDAIQEYIASFVGGGTVGGIAGGGFGAIGAYANRNNPAADAAPTNGGTIFAGQDPATTNPGADGSSIGQDTAPSMVPPGAMGAVSDETLGPIARAAQAAPDLTPQPQAAPLFPDMKPGAKLVLADPQTGELIDATFQREENGVPIVRINGQEQPVPPQMFDMALNAGQKAMEDAKGAKGGLAAQAKPKAPRAPAPEPDLSTLSLEEAQARLAAVEDRIRVMVRPSKKVLETRDKLTEIIKSKQGEANAAVQPDSAAGVAPVGPVQGVDAAGGTPDPVSPAQRDGVPEAPVSSSGEGVAGAVEQPQQGEALAANPVDDSLTPDPVVNEASPAPRPQVAPITTPPSERIQPDPFLAAGYRAGGDPTTRVLEVSDDKGRTGKYVIRPVGDAGRFKVVKTTDKVGSIAIPTRQVGVFDSPEAALAAVEADRGAKPSEAQSAPKSDDPVEDALVAAIENGLVRHTTKKGRTLNGYIAKGISEQQALEADPRTFRSNGGWFIRENAMIETLPEGKRPQKVTSDSPEVIAEVRRIGESWRNQREAKPDHYVHDVRLTRNPGPEVLDTLVALNGGKQPDRPPRSTNIFDFRFSDLEKRRAFIDRVANYKADAAAKTEPKSEPVSDSQIEKPQQPAYGANNKLVTAERAAEVRERLKAKLRDQINSGIDPEILSMGAELAVFHIEAGARRFGDFAKAVASDLGTTPDKVRQYLRGWYNSARDIMEDSGVSIDGMDTPEQVAEVLRAGFDGDAAAEVAQPKRQADNPTKARRISLSTADVAAITTDAKTFQYKDNGDQDGVTERLQGVRVWDEMSAGNALVFEYSDGRRVIADGHQRLGLAKRLQSEGQETPWSAFVFREVDGYTPERVREIAALRNIREGSGTAIDAAKVLRSAKNGEDAMNLPPKSALVRDARALAKLSDDAFGMIINEVAPVNFGAVVGDKIADRRLHKDVLALLVRSQPANTRQAELIAEQAAAATTTETQTSLFGDEEVTETLFLQRAKVLDNALTRIRTQRSAFKVVSERAGLLAEEGNILNNEANARRVENDARMEAYLRAEANRKGPISDALTAAARQLKSEPRSLSKVTDDFIAALRDGEGSRVLGADQLGSGSDNGRGRASESLDGETRQAEEQPDAEQGDERDTETLSLFGDDPAPQPQPEAEQDAQPDFVDRFNEAKAEGARRAEWWSRTSRENDGQEARDILERAGVGFDRLGRAWQDIRVDDQEKILAASDELARNPKTKGWDGKTYPATLEDVADKPRNGQRLTHIYAEYGGQRFYLTGVQGNADAPAAEWRKTYPKASIYTTDRADGTSINGGIAELEAKLGEAKPDTSRVGESWKRWDLSKGGPVSVSVTGAEIRNGKTVYLVQEEGSRTAELLDADMLDRIKKVDAANLSSRSKEADDEKDRAAKVEKAKAEREDIDGFASDKTEIERQKAITVLSRAVDYKGRPISRRDLIREKVAAGAKMGEVSGEKVLEFEVMIGGKPDEAFLDAKALTKIGLDYAEYLIRKRAVESAQRAPAPSYEPGADGKPQAIMPGMEGSAEQAKKGLTDRQRLELEARQKQQKMRRLDGNTGDAGPLFNDQTDLFGAPPVAKTFDAAAAEADPDPTPAQAEAGNYRKGHAAWQGLDLTIETAKGEERRGIDADGNVTWRVKMPAHYGYIKRTTGSDGEQVDFYMGPEPDSDVVVIVDQVDAESRAFDEHKVMLGFRNRKAALDTYVLGFSDGKGKDRLGAHKVLTVAEFKEWLESGDLTKPLRLGQEEGADLASRWDGMSEDERSEIAKRAGWVVQSGDRLNPTGRGIVGRKWADISEGTQATLQRHSAPKAAAKPTKIEDFGQKIGGARKDVWGGFKDRMEEAKGLDIAAEPLSKSWPEPDYEKLIEAGVEPWTVAFMRAAREEIPRKPSKGWKLKGWAEQVQMLRDFSMKLMNGEIAPERVQQALPEKRQLNEKLGTKVEAYLAVGHSKSLKDLNFGTATYSVLNGVPYKPSRTFWEVSKDQKATAFGNMPRTLVRADSKEELLEKFKLLHATLDADGAKKGSRDKGTKFIIYSMRTGADTAYRVGVKIGKNYVDLRTGITDVKEARRIIREESEQLQEQLDRMREIPNERRDENAPRIGADHRNGADVTPQQFAETFGFKGVEFGNWVEQARRQQDLNESYDALMDLASMLDIPPRAISLNGTLGLAFGARGKGGKNPAAAHYEPGKVVINLTKRSGRGSLAHEWFHALDNYFARKRQPMRGNFITDNNTPVGPLLSGIRPETMEAFFAVKRAIMATDLPNRSKRLDKLRSEPYFGTGIEMHARAFESYVIAKLQDQNASNDYLANTVNGTAWSMMADMAGLGDTYPYLKPEEIENVRPAFDELFRVMERRETDQGVALEMRGFDGGFYRPSRQARTFAQSKQKVKEAGFINKPLRHDDSGIVVAISNTNVGKALSDSAVQKSSSPALQSLVVANLDELFLGSTLGWSKPDRDADPNIVAFHRFFNAMEVDGKPVMVKISVKETRQAKSSNSVYSVESFEFGEASSAVKWVVAAADADSTERRPARPSEDVLNMARAVDAFNSGEAEFAPSDSNTDPDFTEDDLRAMTKALNAMPEVRALGGIAPVKVVRRLVSHVTGNDILGRFSASEGVTVKAGRGAIGVMRHEIIHALRSEKLWNKPFGMFTGAEWKELVRAARAEPEIVRSVMARYKDQPASVQSEEMVAELYRMWAGMRDEYGAVGKIMVKVEGFLKALANLLRGQGFVDAGRTMDRIASGKIGGRGPDGPRGGGRRGRSMLKTETRAFERWFGNSKVVDRKGKPLVVYHGTNSDFTAFSRGFRSTGARDAGMGFFFTSDPYVSTAYSSGEGGNTMPVYLSMQNPLVKDMGNASYRPATNVALIEQAKAEGRDGVILKNIRDGGPSSTVYIAFQPSQIKSVFNQGTFDPDSDNIMEMRALPGTVRDKFKPLVGFTNWRNPSEWISNFLTDRMVSENASILALVPGRPLFAEMGKKLLSAKAYLRTKEDMDALRNDWHAKAAEVADEWTVMQKKDPRANDAMMDLMHRSTMTGVDPSKPDDWGKNDQFLKNAKMEVSRLGDKAPDWAKQKLVDEQKRRKTYATVKEMYDALPKEYQDFYVKVKDTYTQLADEWDVALEENIKNAARIAMKNAERAHRQALRKIKDDGLTGAERDEAVAKADEDLRLAKARSQASSEGKVKSLRKIFEGQRLKGPYFPLARFGKYFVTVRNEAGEVVSFSRMETEGRQRVHIAEMREKYPTGKVTFGTIDAKASMKDQVDPKFVAEIEAILGEAGADADLMDSIWQKYLETLPDESIRTSKIHRKGREGFSRDALRAFSHHMFHGSHQLARLKYGLSLQEHIDDAREEARRDANPNRANALVDEMQRRMEWTLNPQNSSWVTAASSLSFVWYLGVSPAAALVNLSQTTIIGPAMMKARFQKASTGKILSELARAAKDFGKGQGNVWSDTWSAENAATLTAEEKAAMAEGYRRGTIDKTQAFDLASVAESGVEYNPFREKWMRRIGWAFHHAERVNREVTYLANYRLARADGLSHADAMDAASDLTWQIHFSYQNSDRARIMQKDWPKFFLQFRQFSVNMLYRLFRDAHQSLNGATAAERKEARTHLIGISLSMMAHAGIRGVWGYGLIMGLLALFFPGDSDELEDWMQDALLMEGDNPGVAAWNFAMGAALNGVPGQITGLSLVERIGMPNLWFREPNRDLEGTDLIQHYVNESLGPTVGILFSLYRGAQMASDGEVVRGFEAMTPKFVRDVVKSGRFAVEGVETMNGDDILESLNPWELLMQANGFTPARVAERYDMNNRLKNREKRVLDERKGLHREASDAIKEGKPIPEKVLEKIRDFNRRFPEYPITGETIRQSFQSRMRASERNEFGVSLNPKLNARLREELPVPLYNG